MKSIPFAVLLFSVAFLSACTKHQYFFVSSDLPKQLDGSFKFEDDTVRVVYSYSPEGNINIEITNKLNELIYVDWEKSSMIFDSEGYPFLDGKTAFEGSSSSYELIDDFQVGSFSGQLGSSPYRRYIPPKSKVSHQFKNVPIDYESLNTTELDRLTLPGGIVGKKYTFNKDDSANTYQSYLYLGAANDEGSHTLRHHFWVAHMVETLHGVQPLPSNQFERSKLTPAGGVLAVAGLVGVMVIVAQVEEDTRKR